jgi:predicted adenylyl cyclase CyaB
MSLEIEIKLKVDSHDPIRAQLRNAGAIPHGTARETNIFFDRPDHSLRAADTGLRVRFTRAPNSPHPVALLTVKQPPGKDALQSREAFDLTLTPHDQIIPLLQALGFEQQISFEKDRETWHLDNCLIELDTLPRFGTFIEIEGPSVEVVQQVQGTLGLSETPAHRASYSRIVSEYLREHREQELRF